MDLSRPSFEEGQQTDLSTMVAELSGIQDSQNIPVPIKKLSEDFDNVMNSSENMKVFLRIRPPASKSSEASSNLISSTMNILSNTTVMTTAPESSKRAQYTKKEERLYAFNRIFGPDSLQNDVFETTTIPLFDKLLEGKIRT